MSNAGTGPAAALAAVLLAATACGGGTGTATTAPPPTTASTTATTAPTPEETMDLTSTAFADGDAIPARHTCSGQDLSPPLAFSDLPPGTGALVLIVEDPDAPGGTWDHWVAYDIPPLTAIPESAAPGVQGRNSWGSLGYRGPCPPSGTHRYHFEAYALDAPLGLAPGAGKAEVMAAMEGRVLARATLMGTYSR